MGKVSLVLATLRGEDQPERLKKLPHLRFSAVTLTGHLPCVRAVYNCGSGSNEYTDSGIGMTKRNTGIRNYPGLPVLFLAFLVSANGCSAEETAGVYGEMNERPESADTQPGQVDIAKRDLAKRLSISPGQINVVEVREVTWRDGSIGCPQPGMLYKQVLVNGSLIVLEAGGTRYEYHSGGGRDPFYCAQPEPPVPPGAEGFGKT